MPTRAPIAPGESFDDPSGFRPGVPAEDALGSMERGFPPDVAGSRESEAPPPATLPFTRAQPASRRLRITVARFAWLVRTFTRHGVALAAEIGRDPERRARLSAPGRLLVRLAALGRRRRPAALSGPERLRVLFEDLGGTFVKFGQMLALQPDILPVEYCDALWKLLDRIEPYPFEVAERTVREELGRAPDQIFERFSRTPLATASVGQVYVAWLDGQKVAVKVQRPNVEIDFASDVRLMVAFIAVVKALAIRPLFWLIEPTTEFVAWSRDELDYRHEARHSERLRRHAETNPIQYVPRVFEELTTRRVLVVEFLSGGTLLELMRARDRGDELALRRFAAAGFDQDRFAANIIANFLGDAFRHGIYHADLHPANLMVLPGNVVGYIDFGITGLMSRYSRRHLVGMTLALARGDVDSMAAEYLKITVHDNSSDLAGFRRGIEQLAAGWYERDGERGRLAEKITKIFNEMLALSRRSNVMPERDIVKYIRSAIAIDGLLGRFAPGFDIGAHLERSCAEHLVSEARRGLVDPDRLLDWASASGRLLERGPARASIALDHAAERLGADGETKSGPGRGAGGGLRRDADLRQRTLFAGGALAVGAALLSLAGPPHPASGPLALDLPTALRLMVAALAATFLFNLASLRRSR